jgi:glycosyltransferase involved in cell wall biosynthesis
MQSPFWNPDPPVSIGMACNIYNDVNAVSGLLECASQFFDDICFYHAGPQGKYSDDGTIEVIEKWKARIVFGSIDDGFGIVRTAAVRACKSEWVMILDADERFWPNAPIFLPHGQVDGNIHMQMFHDCYDQGSLLRRIVRYPGIDAVKTIRRHWNDFSWKRPVQNWHTIPDIQMRIMRNVDYIHYRPEIRMHEQLIDSRNNAEPQSYTPEGIHGPFHDHYHCFFKPMERDQRAHDIAIFDSIHENVKPPVKLTPEQRQQIDLRIHHT